jgi:Tol biopolymer transport system component
VLRHRRASPVCADRLLVTTVSRCDDREDVTEKAIRSSFALALLAVFGFLTATCESSGHPSDREQAQEICAEGGGGAARLLGRWLDEGRLEKLEAAVTAIHAIACFNALKTLSNQSTLPGFTFTAATIPPLSQGLPAVLRSPAGPLAGKLVFGGRRDLYGINIDGTGLARIAGGDHTDRAPEWSPDGLRIAYARDHHIWTMDPSGNHRAQLTSGRALDNAPAWSADGSKIAFDRQATKNGYDVWVMDADGSEPMNLTSRPHAAGSAPDWSPHGEKLVFQRGHSIWVMNSDGSQPTEITPRSPGIELAPSWSPNGRLIVYATFSEDGRRSDIFTMKPDGSAKVNLLTSRRARRGNFPTWSPDGTKIAFAAEDGIWIMNADGSGLRRLLEGSGFGSLTFPYR